MKWYKHPLVWAVILILVLVGVWLWGPIQSATGYNSTPEPVEQEMLIEEEPSEPSRFQLQKESDGGLLDYSVYLLTDQESGCEWVWISGYVLELIPGTCATGEER